METRLLKMFCAVARHGSVAAAARQLHLTPSAISHSLKALENQLGCRLFDRAARKMLLNQAGEQLLAKIEQPLAALDALAKSEGMILAALRLGVEPVRPVDVEFTGYLAEAFDGVAIVN